MTQPFWQTPDGSVPVHSHSSCSSPLLPPQPLGCELRAPPAAAAAFGGSRVGDAAHCVPCETFNPRRQRHCPRRRGPASTRHIPGWGCQRAPGSRGGLGGCDYSIWSNPDLLTKAKLFLKNNHSAKFTSAARPAAAARRRGEIRPGKRCSGMPGTG